MCAFDNSEFENYKAEAQERWGKTDAYKEHAEKTKDYNLDVLIIGRGGGSKDDLAAFDDEDIEFDDEDDIESLKNRVEELEDLVAQLLGDEDEEEQEVVETATEVETFEEEVLRKDERKCLLKTQVVKKH